MRRFDAHAVGAPQHCAPRLSSVERSRVCCRQAGQLHGCTGYERQLRQARLLRQGCTATMTEQQIAQPLGGIHCVIDWRCLGAFHAVCQVSVKRHTSRIFSRERCVGQ